MTEGAPPPVPACGWRDSLVFGSIRSGEHGAGGACDLAPELLPGIGGREVKDDPSDRLFYPGADLKESLPKGSHLGASELGPPSAQAQLLEEDVGGVLSYSPSTRKTPSELIVPRRTLWPPFSSLACSSPSSAVMALVHRRLILITPS